MTRADPRKGGEGFDEQWTKFSLFHLKYVLDGADSDSVKRLIINVIIMVLSDIY